MTESIVREATISSPNISIRRLYILNQQGVGLGEEWEDCYSSGSQPVENRGLSFSWSGTLKATVWCPNNKPAICAFLLCWCP